ncbi:hypothetical protein LEP1GSC079_4073 [Leptospira interrogans str. FPW1039]|uniref:Uncharacterized protein n=1 Tax=Leptospira interrogans str. FPW1039 TaxID=1193040 RepID=A0A0F6IL95_LEPIR|nr:hypothetical protein LEP1GSC079_4073 [Leptospira interrogans str. FPW1039]
MAWFQLILENVGTTTFEQRTTILENVGTTTFKQRVTINFYYILSYKKETTQIVIRNKK